jgi:predicted transcriptional regulator
MLIKEEPAELQAFQEEFEQMDLKFLKRIKELIIRYQKPTVVVSLMQSEKILKEETVIYSMPEQAVQVLKKLYEYYQYLSKNSSAI